MSIQSLLFPNDLNLQCKSITTSGGGHVDKDPVIIGTGATASGGTGCVAVGKDAGASGVESVGLGGNAQAGGNGSLSLGVNSKATVQEGIAIGPSADSAGLGSVSLGKEAFAWADGSVAIGADSKTSLGPGAACVSIGQGAKSGLGSIAIGQGAEALADGDISLGLNAGTGAAAAGTGVISISGIPVPAGTDPFMGDFAIPITINGTVYRILLVAAA